MEAALSMTMEFIEMTTEPGQEHGLKSTPQALTQDRTLTTESLSAQLSLEDTLQETSSSSTSEPSMFKVMSTLTTQLP
jgi:hypothetical protein